MILNIVKVKIVLKVTMKIQNRNLAIVEAN